MTHDIDRRVLNGEEKMVIEQFCSGRIAKSDAMTALHIHCVEDLYAMIIEGGFELPRQSREDALESGRATTNFIKSHAKS